MSDLISRQEAIDIVHWYYRNMYGEDAERSICESIENLPSAEPKRGKWLETEQPMGWIDVRCATCSECGKDYILDEYTIEDFGWNFCANCGAKMEKE